MLASIPSGRLDETITANMKRIGITPEYLHSLAASRQRFDVASIDAKMAAAGLAVHEKIAVKGALARAGVL